MTNLCVKISPTDKLQWCVIVTTEKKNTIVLGPFDTRSEASEINKWLSKECETTITIIAKANLQEKT